MFPYVLVNFCPKSTGNKKRELTNETDRKDHGTTYPHSLTRMNRTRSTIPLTKVKNRQVILQPSPKQCLRRIIKLHKRRLSSVRKKFTSFLYLFDFLPPYLSLFLHLPSSSCSSLTPLSFSSPFSLLFFLSLSFYFSTVPPLSLSFSSSVSTLPTLSLSLQLLFNFV